MSIRAKWLSTRSSGGSGNRRDFFCRAVATRGDSRGDQGGGAPFGRARGLLATLVLTLFAFSLTAAPAFGDGFEATLDPPTPSYTSANLTGTIVRDNVDFYAFALQVSTDGVHFVDLPCIGGVTCGSISSKAVVPPDQAEFPINTPFSLDPGTKYFFRIRYNLGQKDGHGPFWWSFSNVVSATTLAIPKPTVFSIADAADASYTTAKASGSVEGVEGPDPGFESHCRFEYNSDENFKPKNEVQTLLVGGNGGTFTLAFRDKSTPALPYNASASAVQTALEALPTVGTGNLSVSGDPGSNSTLYTVVFGGSLGGQNVSQILIDHAGLTGEDLVVANAETSEKNEGHDGFFGGGQAPCNPETVGAGGPSAVTADLSGLVPDTTYHLRLAVSNAGGGDTKVAANTFTTLPVDPPAVLTVGDATNIAYSQADLSGSIQRPTNPDHAFDAECRFEYVSAADYGTRSEIQRLTVRATSGTFTLAFGGSAPSAPLNFDASAAEVQAALESLPGIGAGNVSVSGGPGDEKGEDPYTFFFGGALAGKDIGGVAVDTTKLQPQVIGNTFIGIIAEGHGPEGFNLANSVPCNPEVVESPGGPNPVTATPTGLEPGTTYHYRLIASNPGGSDFKEAANTFTTLAPGAPVVSILPPSAVTTNSAHFSGKINPGGTDAAFNVTWRFKCTPRCPGIEGGVIEADETEHEVSVDATGLRSNIIYSVTLIATNGAGEIVAGPEQFTTVAAEPGVTTFPAFALAGGTKALVGGKVDPENSATKYWIEYGADEGYGTSIPLAQDASAGSGEDPSFVKQEMSGLQPSTTYHFRLVASNAAGTEQGHDYTFTTPADGLGSSIGSAGVLPDNRAWEMVSPPSKNNADVWPVEAQASVSGDRLMYKSQSSFGDQPTSKGGSLLEYIATRGGTSWSTHGINAPGGGFCFSCFGVDYTDELEFHRFIRREFVSESLDPDFTGLEPGQTTIDRTYIKDDLKDTYKVQPNGFAGASDDYSHVVIQSGDELTPDGCTFFCVYERVGSEPLRLASRRVDGTSEYGQFNAISKDGSRIYFTGLETGGLFVRVDGNSTLEVSESERTIPPVGGGGETKLAGIDGPSGERALLLTGAELVDADEDFSNDLYLWDGTKPKGERLTLVSQGDTPGVEAEVSGVLGNQLNQFKSQEGLQRGYFIASNQVLAGHPTLPGQKIYYWEAADGAEPTLDYVATAAPEADVVRVSPNRRYLAFVSSERLTAFDNGGKQQVYRYDSVSGQLACVSCDPEGRAAKSNASFETGSPPGLIAATFRVSRNVSNNGQVFFETSDSLVLGDSNGKRDVYEYTGGLPHMLSLGTGARESRFLDASASGDDVFIATIDRLVRWDVDRSIDAYDVRVDGGLPEPPLPVVGCEGDSCQAPPVPPNDPTPASSNFNGTGNVNEKSALKKKKKRQHKAHKKKQQTKKHRHSRNSTRKNG